MKKSVRELLEKARNAVRFNLGRDAVYAPAAKAYRLVLHDNPWFAWELAVQFHLGKKKLDHAKCILYKRGWLGMNDEINAMLLACLLLNVGRRVKKIGSICPSCYKKIKGATYALLCADCHLEKEYKEEMDTYWRNQYL